MSTWFKALLGTLTAPLEAAAGPDLRPALAPMAVLNAAIGRPELADTMRTTGQDDMSRWLAAQGLGDMALSEAHWRTFALATEVARNLAAGAMTNLFRPGSVPPVMYLMPILPGSWRMEERRIAGLWLRDVVTRSGWPSERLALSAEVPADARATAPSSVLTRLAYHGALSGMPLAGMVIAAAWSNPDASPAPAIDDGAAGLLLVDEAQAGSLGLAYTTLKRGLAIGNAVPYMAELARTHNHAIACDASALCISNQKPRRHPTDMARDAAPVPPFLP